MTTTPERAASVPETELEIRPLKYGGRRLRNLHQLQVERPDSIQALLLSDRELERLRCLLDMYNEREPERDRFTDDTRPVEEGSPS
jgi:hypothetical protein